MIESCAIVTRAAVSPLDAVHDRMPIVLRADSWLDWLDPKNAPEPMLQTACVGELVVRAVSTHVNDTRHDDPECVQRIDAPAQRTLFAS